MSATAWQVVKFPQGVPQGPVISPFMRSTNSEYGNWFQRAPPSPFTVTSGTTLPQNFNIGTRKLTVRKLPSYNAVSRGGNDDNYNILQHANNQGKTEVIVNQTIPLPNPHRPRPTAFTYARSLSYNGDVSPRDDKVVPGGSLHTSSHTAYPHNAAYTAYSHSTAAHTAYPHSNITNSQSSDVSHSRFLERSNTVPELESPRRSEILHGVGLRRSRTFTETSAPPPWRSYRDAEMNCESSPAITPSPYHRASSILPNALDVQQKLSEVSLGQSRSPLYVIYGSKGNDENHTDSKPQSTNPYNTDIPVKTYHGLTTETFKLHTDAENAAMLKSDLTHKSSPRLADIGPRVVKTVKPILKKKSAYENNSTFARSDDYYQSWGSYSNPSALSYNRSQDSGYRGVGALRALAAQEHNNLRTVKKRTSSKKVTFSL